MLFNTWVVSFVLSFISCLPLFFIYLFPNTIVLLIATIALLLFFVISIHLFKMEKKHFILQFFSFSALFFLLSLVEGRFFSFSILALSVLVFLPVWAWSLLYRGEVINFKLKPLRRVVVFVWTFNFFVFATSIFALVTFFSQILFILPAFGGAILAGLIGYFIFDLYQPEKTDLKLLMSGLLGLVMIEIILVFKFMPFGYFSSGLFVAWLWYLIQLFIRFSLDSRGIIWKKQILFLFANLALFGLVMYFTRWI